jgi:hypothetical protein
MILATYATYEQMHGYKSTIADLIRQLQQFSRESVLYACAVTGIILKLWEREGWRTNYDVAIDGAFEFIRGDWFKVAARLKNPELVFHRRQLLFLMKLAVEHCPASGDDLARAVRGSFGTMLLMVNDHFHYGLYPFPGRDGVDEFEKLSRVVAEFVPVSEYSGFLIENKLARAHIMMTKYTNQLRGHADFIDIGAEYEKVTGISLLDYEALALGLFTRCTVNITLEALRTNAWVAAIRPENFHQTAIPRVTVDAFLREFTDTPEGVAASIAASRRARQDFGPNDFTVFRKKPLIREVYGSLPTDVFFVIEKFETGPYWCISGIDTSTGDKLHRFWGAVFEQYVNGAVAAATKMAGSRFIPNPRLISDPNVQVCDALLIEGDALVVMEYKASMFTARSKYSGDHVRLRDEIEAKLVRDRAENKKKGVEQLADAVALLFSDPSVELIKGLDVSSIKRVYPLLVTLDDLGASLLISRLLNLFFAASFKRDSKTFADVRPVFCTDIESFETVLPYIGMHALSDLLQHWLDQDGKLMGTLLSRLPEGLQYKRNEFLDKVWESLNQESASRLFPEEHQARKTAHPSE